MVNGESKAQKGSQGGMAGAGRIGRAASRAALVTAVFAASSPSCGTTTNGNVQPSETGMTSTTGSVDTTSTGSSSVSTSGGVASLGGRSSQKSSSTTSALAGSASATSSRASSSSSPSESGSSPDAGKVAEGGADATGGSTSGLPWLSVVGNTIQDPTGKTVILRGLSIEGLYDQSQTSLGIDGLLDKITNPSDPASNSPGWYTRIVRLPVDPYGANSFQSNPNYVTQILKPAVDYATSKNLYAIVDLHYVDNPYNLVSQVNAFWTKVAPIFKDYPNVVYEVFNESNQTDSWATYKPTMQAWVNLIRSYAPNNLIFAGSPSWDQSMGDAATNPLSGGNIAYTVHMYEQHYASAWNRQQVQTCAAVHPVVMTEWGFCACSGQPGTGTTTGLVNNYGASMLTWLEAMNGGWTGWCASNSWLPDMFNANWSLKVGPDEMGGFVKDWMYEKANP
jgi:endoglucanase